MTTKLNLTIDEDLVVEIKKFAKKNNRSVSQIVTEQLNVLINKPSNKKIPFSKRAAGIIKGDKFNDVNKLREEYLKEDYGI
jgi:hypothetical protein